MKKGQTLTGIGIKKKGEKGFTISTRNTEIFTGDEIDNLLDGVSLEKVRLDRIKPKKEAVK